MSTMSIVSTASTLSKWLMEPNLRFNFPHNHISFVLYYPKCNCNCFYCNLKKVFIGCIPFDWNSLELSLPFIDCIVVSGGEPLLAFDDILIFQEFARQHDLWFYVYTNGFNVSKISQLLDNYEKTIIVIDVKGSKIEQINKTTRSNLGKQIIQTYKAFCNHDRVVFRINEYVKPLDFKNIERYKTVEVK